MKFYERHTFLEFFDREEILDEEVRIAKYIISLEDKTIFSLHISPYENYAVIELANDDVHKIIFEIGIHNLDDILCTKDSLHFFKKNNEMSFPYQDIQLKEPFLIVRVKPTVSFQCDL